MLLLVLLCVLIAFAMLVLAVVTSTAIWAWGSVVASLLAAGLLVTDFVVRRRGDRRGSDARQQTATASPTSAPSLAGGPGPQGPPGGNALGGDFPAGRSATTAAVTPPPGQAPADRGAAQHGRDGLDEPTRQAGAPGWSTPPPPGAPTGPPQGGAPAGPGQPPGRGRPGMPPVALPFASASGRLGRDPSRVPGAPAGSRFLGMVTLPGSPASTRRAAHASAPAVPPPGRAPAGWASQRSAPPPHVDPATTRIDPARLADAAAAAPPPFGAPGATGSPQGGTFGAPGASAPAAPPVGAEPGPSDEPADPAQTAIVQGVDTEVLVIDEEPYFHLDRCSYLARRDVIPIPASEALELGFMGCSWCSPVATLASTHGADSRR